jgi:hypothetical protein
VRTPLPSIAGGRPHRRTAGVSSRQGAARRRALRHRLKSRPRTRRSAEIIDPRPPSRRVSPAPPRAARRSAHEAVRRASPARCRPAGCGQAAPVRRRKREPAARGETARPLSQPSTARRQGKEGANRCPRNAPHPTLSPQAGRWSRSTNPLARVRTRERVDDRLDQRSASTRLLRGLLRIMRYIS